MNILMILKIIAAVATLATGVLAFVKPSAAYGFTGLNANGIRGVSEIRAVFGGLFIGLGFAPFTTTAQEHDKAMAYVQGLNFISTVAYLAAQARAAIRGRNYVIPDDVKALAVPVLLRRGDGVGKAGKAAVYGQRDCAAGVRRFANPAGI